MPKTSFYSGTGITSEKADAVESSANAAAQSAANAATSEANALTSETNAASSAANALTSETNAATSASNASTSESNALASATSAQNLEVTSASFDTTDGTLTLTKANSGTVTTDLDGRYLTTHQDITGKADLSGATFTGQVYFNDHARVPDDKQLFFGASGDLRLSHSSSNNTSYIGESGTGSLVIYGTDLYLKDSLSGGNRYLYGNSGAETTLYFNGDEKLSTTNTGVNFEGDITLTGTLATGGYTLASTDGTSGQALVTDGNGNVSFGDIIGDVSGKADLSGATFTGDITAKSKLIVNKQPVASDLLTTSRSIQDLAAWYVYVFSGSNYALTPEKYRDSFDTNQDNRFTSADSSSIFSFVSNNYTGNEFSTFQSLVGNPSNITSTFVQDVLDGDYDSLSTSAGVAVDRDASSIVTVSGDIAVSGTVDGRDVSTDGDKLDLIEASADVTNATNVTAAGAAMLTGADFTGDVTTTGNVGIGTTSPDYPLDIEADTAQARIHSTVGNSVLRLDSVDTGESKIYFADNSAAAIGTIEYHHNTNHMSFATDATTRMLINSSGKVGIGTSLPSGAYAQPSLHIHATGNGAELHLTDVTSGATSSDGMSIFQYANDGYIHMRENGSLRTYVNGEERMRIDSLGNVGIGTSSPQDKLHVSTGTDTDSGNIAFTIGGTSTSNGRTASITKNTSTPYELTIQAGNHATSNMETVFKSSDSKETMRIDSSGNVGIGTSSPQAKLEVKGGTGVASTGGTLVVRQDGDAYSDGIALTSSNSTSHRIWKDSSGKLNIGPSTVPSALVQDLSGNVGIGTDSPDAKLHVQGGDIKITSDSASGADGIASVIFTEYNDDHDSYNADVAHAIIAYNGSPVIGDANYLGFGVFNQFVATEDTLAEAKLLTDLNITRDGKVGIGTTSPTEALDVVGNIAVSGTVDGRDVSVDGTKLDTLERVYRRRFAKNAYSFSSMLQYLTTAYLTISPEITGHVTTGSENEVDFQITSSHYDINSANEFIFYVRLKAPYSGAEDTVNLGTVSAVSSLGSFKSFNVDGDVTKHLSPYCGMSTTSTGANAFSFDNNHSWFYDIITDKTVITTYGYQSNLPSDGDTLYLHPFDWESTGTYIIGDFYPADAYNASGTVNIRRDYKIYLGYFKNRPVLEVFAKETTSVENIAINSVGGVLTQYQD